MVRSSTENQAPRGVLAVARADGGGRAAVGGLASASPGLAMAGLLIALCLQFEHVRVFAVLCQQELV